MSLALLFSLLVLQAGPASDAELRARFALSPVEVEVGEPFQLNLLVDHPSAVGVFDLQLKPLELDPSWVLLDASRDTAKASSDEPGRSVTTWHWRIVSLEPGERRLLPELTSLVEDERVGAVDLSSTSIQVHSVLAESEDQPRALRGLPAGFGDWTEEAPNAWQRAWPILLGLGLSALAAWLWRRLRKPAMARGEELLVPLAELEVLRAQPVLQAADLRQRHFDLTRLVRRGVDEKLGVSRAGLTDDEWLSAVEGGLLGYQSLADLLPELRDFLGAAEAVKYAGEQPSEWALEETHKNVRQILERLRGDGRSTSNEAAAGGTP